MSVGIVHDQDLITLSNGVIAAGLTDALTLSIDIPDVPNGQFTLRQLAVIPEPSSACLCLIGLFAWAWRRR